MEPRRYSLALPLSIFLLATCAAPKRSADVWDSYDVRQHGSESVIDNDQYYVAPDCSIMDSPSCGSD